MQVQLARMSDQMIAADFIPRFTNKIDAWLYRQNVLDQRIDCSLPDCRLLQLTERELKRRSGFSPGMTRHHIAPRIVLLSEEEVSMANNRRVEESMHQVLIHFDQANPKATQEH